jgi:ribosome biogenesis GTPase
LTSCKTGEGIDALLQQLDTHTSIVVGQSGVGKSSLINQILPDAEELVGDVSSGSGLGQHTTTASKLLHLPAGGDLIDSPGVREFGLWHLPEDRVTWAFREFRDYIGGCKFRDCKHLDEPGCLIRQAAEKGDIAMVRLDSYHRIIASMQEQKPAYL